MAIRRKIRKLPGLTKKDKPRDMSPMNKRALNVARSISDVNTELERDVRTREVIVNVTFRLDYDAVDDFRNLTDWPHGNQRMTTLRHTIQYLERLNAFDTEVRIAMDRPKVRP